MALGIVVFLSVLVNQFPSDKNPLFALVLPDIKYLQKQVHVSAELIYLCRRCHINVRYNSAPAASRRSPFSSLRFFLFPFHSLPFPFSSFFPLFPYICSLFFKTTSEVLSKAVEYINVLIGRGECGHCSRSTFFTLSLGTLGVSGCPPRWGRPGLRSPPRHTRTGNRPAPSRNGAV